MKKTISQILDVLDKNERKSFYRLILADIFISFMDILSLALLLWIMQFYIGSSAGAVPAFIPDWLAKRDSALLIMLFTLLFGIKNVMGYGVAQGQYRFQGRVTARLSEYNLAAYQRAPFSSFVQTDSSVHIRNISFHPFEFAQNMLSGLQQIITQVTLISISIAAILFFNAQIFLLLLFILMPPVAVVFWFIKKRLSKARNAIQTSNEYSFRYLLDALKGYVESNLYQRNDFFLQRFTRARSIFSRHLFHSLALQNLPGRMIEIFAVLGLCVLILIAKLADDSHTHTLITIGAFMAAAYKIIPGMVKIINVTGQMKAYSYSIEGLQKDRSAPVLSIKESVLAVIESITFSSVVFSYQDQTILDRFSMQINPGEMVGITGPSGRGKTTLFNLLLGFLDAEKGSILVNGKPMNSLALRRLWPMMAYVRQQGFFIHDTLLRNITLEEDGYDSERLEQVIAISGLDQVLKHFPEGAAKMIAENGKNISGGQQQRIAIARALYKNASLILLDEPFNELDEESVEALMHYLCKLTDAGKTVVMITHDKKCLSHCHKIISLDERA